MERDPAKDLETLVLFVDSDVKTVVQAALVTLDVTLRFERLTPEQKRALYVTNPANTVAFQAMRALEDQAIVRVAEALGKEAKLLPRGTELPAKVALVHHRNAISHPYIVVWTSPGMQPFFDANRQWHDIRAAIVWDVWRSLNDELVKLGKPARDMTVGIYWQHAALVHHILRASLRPEYHAAIPSEQSILDHLPRFRDDFLKLLVEKPDGRNQEAEHSSLAHHEEQRQRWSKSEEPEPAG
jgi:hypothetical protein